MTPLPLHDIFGPASISPVPAAVVTAALAAACCAVWIRRRPGPTAARPEEAPPAAGAPHESLDALEQRWLNGECGDDQTLLLISRFIIRSLAGDAPPGLSGLEAVHHAAAGGRWTEQALESASNLFARTDHARFGYDRPGRDEILDLFSQARAIAAPGDSR